MAAYVILDIEITNPERFAQYAREAPAVLERYGGRYLTRGGFTEVLEGAWQPHRLVVVEFASIEKAKAWWDSPDYAGPKALRQSASISSTVLAQGV